MNPIVQIMITLDEAGKIDFRAGGHRAQEKALLVYLLEQAKFSLLTPPAPTPAPEAPKLLLARGALPPFNGKG